jgi:hypothetical protein
LKSGLGQVLLLQPGFYLIAFPAQSDNLNSHKVIVMKMSSKCHV